MRTRLLLATLGLATALAGAGCSGCNNQPTSGGATVEGGAAPTSSSLTPEDAKKVLAKVGDTEITLGMYVAALEHMDQFDRLRYQSVERRKELLQEMINVMLLAREAKDKGYDKDPIAQEELRAILRDAMLQAARKGAPSPTDIPDSEVKAYFDAHKADYKDPERRRVSLIVLRDAATAKDVLAQAQKTPGASQWGELVRAKSIDPQAKANVPVDLAGDFGLVSPPGDSRGENGRVPPEVRAAVFEIKNVGDVLDHPVAAAGKFYLVRLAQKNDAHERSLAEAERTIRVKLSQDKIRAREEDLLNELKKQFPVQIDEAALSTVHVDLADGGAGTAAAADAARE
jgi:parvulin-like peptidyl-prolyl isomerase